MKPSQKKYKFAKKTVLLYENETKKQMEDVEKKKLEKMKDDKKKQKSLVYLSINHNLFYFNFILFFFIFRAIFYDFV